ncbi:hypothetical protein EIN_047320 [Entamoeba invadens IP1]|uniref:Uncharacterized protein n=1 Tax=Entamoeba invadens IP1 TaxID=370355 RepID=A0A0A1UDB6_ENTIV|nr:hypothetical protein EIN_047320 [Entamoeba invadens IP1]ELP94439.1 hypothetical protein EIN_047320 [Entamoeba invadens IP1]|eukprot:XP_004261210.1 hypothetical protein EIN_047320 [Entamoeba invadens IP1]
MATPVNVTIPLEDYITLRLVHNQLETARKQHKILLEERVKKRKEIEDIQLKLESKRKEIQTTTRELASLRGECEIEKQKIILISKMPRPLELHHKKQKKLVRNDKTSKIVTEKETN